MAANDNKRLNRSSDNHFKDASFSSRTTVTVFVLSYEATKPRERLHRPSYSSLSSDHDLVAFTPSHEKLFPTPRPVPAASRTPTKKSIPWLRQPQTSLEFSLPPMTRTRTNTVRLANHSRVNCFQRISPVINIATRLVETLSKEYTDHGISDTTRPCPETSTITSLLRIGF